MADKYPQPWTISDSGPTSYGVRDANGVWLFSIVSDLDWEEQENSDVFSRETIGTEGVPPDNTPLFDQMERLFQG